MMMPIPIGLTIIFWLSVVLAVWLVFLVRADNAQQSVVMRYWRFVEDSISHALILMMLSTATLQILARHIFPPEITVPWTEEGGRLMMVWAAMWGAAALQRTDDHISMTALYDAASDPLKRLILAISDLVTLAVLVPIVYWGWENARALDIMTSISLGLPLSIFAYSVPVTGAIMILYSLRLLSTRFRGELARGHQDLQDV